MPGWDNETKHRIIAYDCLFFLGDRPCTWHKQIGVLCKCKRYIKVREHILIIKLDAMGDVLRTTCILPVIDKAWPGAQISWITRQESIPLLENNPYIADIIPYGTEACIQLSTRVFDKVINLDAGKQSAGMASMARAKNKYGYILHDHGYVQAANKAAERWLRLGLFDDLKRKNSRTYQEWMADILGLQNDGMRYVLELTDSERVLGRKRLEHLGVNLKKKIIGIHTGAGARWPQKQWGEDKIIALIKLLSVSKGDKYQIVLFGGPGEKEMNRRIIAKAKLSVFNAGTENTVRQFAAMLGQCSVVLSGDSLAMHVALALGRRAVVLFGPTSPAEIELFSLGEKLVSPLNCVSCYKKECESAPTCMESISVDSVIDALCRQLSKSRKSNILKAQFNQS